MIGFAIARAFSSMGRDVVMLEADRTPGMHASSRNSEVLHAYAKEKGIAHRRVGKLVVATSDAEVGTLSRQV